MFIDFMDECEGMRKMHAHFLCTTIIIIYYDYHSWRDRLHIGRYFDLYLWIKSNPTNWIYKRVYIDILVFGVVNIAHIFHL